MSSPLPVETNQNPDESIVTLVDHLPDDLTDVADCRSALDAASESIKQRFLRGESVTGLVHLRARLIDVLLTRLWQNSGGPLAGVSALVAVGGYGRGELHPFSDVDIMILVPDLLPAGAEAAVSAFVTLLWDIGLEIGHSVRNTAECVNQSKADVTVTTTLIEARLITGDAALFDTMQEKLGEADVWPGVRFFTAKLEEQKIRHHRFDDTAYKLEPNVKASPGGLRDYQMIGWLAKHHLGIRSLDELVELQFLMPGQRTLLNDSIAFLWRVRFGLHILSGRGEDRLLFDHQARLAEVLGYKNESHTLAVEQMMQRYYRTVMELSRLNEMLLQLFEESLTETRNETIESVDARFEVRNGYLRATHDNVFEQDPSALLELFVVLQQRRNIRGVSARTIGLVRQNLHRITAEFRQDPRNHQLFLTILRAPAGVTRELRRMNLYGVLGLYIPAFGKIVGRMQYDLFHAYTVDEHSLFVVSNLRRFALARFDHEFPHCSPLMQSFEQPENVYLAALFHDIAKGRGGDHSELGAIDAESFCLDHGLGQYRARTVAWLVRHHLALSMTAQKKDLGDPSVINEFAALVRDEKHLEYLYVLTVADVRGTNPKLWNSWKATLFRDLYEKTARVLRQGLENPMDRELLIQETRNEAWAKLGADGVSRSAANALWDTIDDEYFLKYRGAEVAWHTRLLTTHNTDQGFVDVRKQSEGDGMEAVFFTSRTHFSFAQATATLDELGMTIVDVRVVPINDEYSLDTYVFLELDHGTQVDEYRMEKVGRELKKSFATQTTDQPQITRSASRQARMFTTTTHVGFSRDRSQQRTIMELVASDRPGLLCTVAQTFVELKIDIETAKILTIGERAEDVFYISSHDDKPLNQEQCDALRELLIRRIDNKMEQHQ